MAASPGKVDGEAAEQVEEGPGQDDDVVDVQEDDNHLGRVADACSGKPQNWAREGALTRPPAQLRRGLRPLSEPYDSAGPRLPALSSPSLAGEEGLFSLSFVALDPGFPCPSILIGFENSLI